jgi:hypothetical protein
MTKYPDIENVGDLIEALNGLVKDGKCGPETPLYIWSQTEDGLRLPDLTTHENEPDSPGFVCLVDIRDEH